MYILLMIIVPTIWFTLLLWPGIKEKSKQSHKCYKCEFECNKEYKQFISDDELAKISQLYENENGGASPRFIYAAGICKGISLVIERKL